MFGSLMLDLALGLAFLYLLLSLVCSALNELIASAFKLRAAYLWKGIETLLKAGGTGTSVANDLYEHPLIKSLSQEPSGKLIPRIASKLVPGTFKPSYIPSRAFAVALLDVLAHTQPSKGKEGPEAASVLQAAAGSSKANDQLKTVLSLLFADAAGDLAKARVSLERWFNDTMDRVSGWYRRRTQLILLALAIVVSVALNADTLVIGNELVRNATLRATVVAAAEQFSQSSPRDTSAAAGARLTELRAEVQQLGLPIGWDPTSPHLWLPHGKAAWLNKILGLLLTAFAISLGAPFWFDVLNRVSKLRGTGGRPGEAKPAAGQA